MKRIDLTSIPVFDTILDFHVDGEYIDLHNNFICTKVETDPFHKWILFHFESSERYFRLVFFQAKIFHFQLETTNLIMKKGLCFESLSRIKAIMNDEGKFLDLPENSGYYEVSFYGDVSFVLEARKVLLQESSITELELMRTLEQQIESLTSQITTLKKGLADLGNQTEVDTKSFLVYRKKSREGLVNLEIDLKQKQEQLAEIREQDRLLLTAAF